MDHSNRAAYHGPTWKPRLSCLRDEIREGRIWRACGYDAEYGRLTDVVLYMPGPDIAALPDPDSGLHVRRIDHPRLRSQHEALVRAYEGFGVRVHAVDPSMT